MPIKGGRAECSVDPRESSSPLGLRLILVLGAPVTKTLMKVRSFHSLPK